MHSRLCVDPWALQRESNLRSTHSRWCVDPWTVRYLRCWGCFFQNRRRLGLVLSFSKAPPPPTLGTSDTRPIDHEIQKHPKNCICTCIKQYVYCCSGDRPYYWPLQSKTKGPLLLNVYVKTWFLFRDRVGRKCMPRWGAHVMSNRSLHFASTVVT